MSNPTPPNQPYGAPRQPPHPQNQPGYTGQHAFSGQPGFSAAGAPYGVQPPPPNQKGRWFTSKPILAGAALIIGIAIGAAGGGESTVATAGSPAATTTAQPTATVTTKAEPAPTKTVTTKAEPAPTKTVTAKAEPAPTKTVTVEKTVTAAPEPDQQEAADDDSAAQVGDGTHIIGEDVQAGTYRTLDPVDGGLGLCYADVQTEDGDFLEQEVTDAGKTVIKVSSKGYTFKSSGCGSWERVK